MKNNNVVNHLVNKKHFSYLYFICIVIFLVDFECFLNIVITAQFEIVVRHFINLQESYFNYCFIMFSHIFNLHFRFLIFMKIVTNSIFTSVSYFFIMMIAYFMKFNLLSLNIKATNLIIIIVNYSYGVMLLHFY